MRATPIVMRYPLGQDRPQLPFIERNDVVETFSARCPDQTLAERVRLRHADRCFQDAQIHRSQRVVNSAREHGIAIVHDKPVRFFACQHASELQRGPLRGRMFRDIPMQNPTSADVQHQEHVHDPERGRHHHEEIARQCLAGVVPHKRAPRLRR